MNIERGYEKYIEQQKIENEIATNKVVMFVDLVFSLLFFVVQFSLLISYSYGLNWMNMHIGLPICLLQIVLSIVAIVVKFKPSWVKHMLLAGLVIGCLSYFLVYSVYSGGFVILAIFVANRYLDEKIIIRISIAVTVLFVLCCAFNNISEHYSSFMISWHNILALNPWKVYIDTFAFVVLPMIVILVFITIYSVQLTKTGKKIFMTIAESTVRVDEVEFELCKAAEIQVGALPPREFCSPDGNVLLRAEERTAKEVGGDFYDYFMVDEHRLAFLIADVSGKGVPAAMFMMSAKKAIRCAIQSCDDIGEAMALSNRLICQDNDSEMFLTLWCCIIDTRTGMGKYANAGHPAPILKHIDGTAEWLANEPCLFMGAIPEEVPVAYPFALQKGESIVLYTDGVTDATNSEGAVFGADRLVKRVTDSANGPDKIIGSVMDGLSEFGGDTEQFDDTTLVAVYCAETEEPEVCELAIEAEQGNVIKVMEAIDRMLQKKNCPRNARLSIDVIIDELCSNICCYAYDGGSGTMNVDVRVGSNYAKLKFSDSGKEFNPLKTNDLGQIVNNNSKGLGLHLVRSVADFLEYEYSNGRNIITVTKMWNR